MPEQGKGKLGVAVQPPLGHFTDVMQCSLQKQPHRGLPPGGVVLSVTSESSPPHRLWISAPGAAQARIEFKLATHFVSSPAQQDISLWPVTGHFYLALK
jgi:hypothetical protein